MILIINVMLLLSYIYCKAAKMKMPFSTEQFLGVFKEYNTAVWPFQVVLIAIAIFSIVILIAKPHRSRRSIPSVLAFFWLWMGVVYHLLYFTEINKAAYAFAAIFILQGLLFLMYGFTGKLSFRLQFNFYGITGSILMLYGLIVYPILGYLMGHIYPSSPIFGLPCPTTIFTLGILLCADKRVPVALLIIPVLWSAIGFMAAASLGIKEDTGLLLAGLIAAITIPALNRGLRNLR
jgi:hypothetical protein